MPFSVEKDEARCLIRLEGEIGLSEAVELKALLIEGLASGRKLHLDLERAEQIDVTFMQLLQAVLLEAYRAGVELAMRMSEAAEIALLGAGFSPCVETRGWTG